MGKKNGLRKAALGISFALCAGISFMCAEKSEAKKIFLSNPADSSVSIVDLETLKEVGKIHVGHDPYFPAVSGDGKTLAVTVEGEGKIKYYDTQTLKLIAEENFGKMDADHMMTLPDGKTMVIADNPGSAVAFIDIATRKELSRIDVSTPHNIQFGHSGNYVYVTSKKNPGISVIDVNNRSLKRFYPTDVIPRGLMVSPDEKTIYFGARWISGIFTMDVETGKMDLIQFPLPHNQTQMKSSTYHSFWTVNDSIVIGVNEGFSSADVINVKARKLEDRFEDVSSPSTVAPIPGSPDLYLVTNFGDNSVKILKYDPATRKLSLHKEGVVGQGQRDRPKRYAFWQG